MAGRVGTAVAVPRGSDGVDYAAIHSIITRYGATGARETGFLTHFAYRIPRPYRAFEPAPRRNRRMIPRVEALQEVFTAAGAKRALDLVISVVAIVLLAPVMLLAALAVKLTSPGPVLFRQERVGIERRRTARRGGEVPVRSDRRAGDRRVVVNPGRPFTIYKFRTMVSDAEKGVPVWARKNDSRITPVGRFLRRTRIDEIPQFFNVLRGDMSVVGPRPERAYFMAQIERDIPQFRERLRVKPGITGLAQVELGYTNSVEGLRKKLGYDLRYIQRPTPVTDLSILARTVGVVISGKGAC